LLLVVEKNGIIFLLCVVYSPSVCGGGGGGGGVSSTKIFKTKVMCAVKVKLEVITTLNLDNLIPLKYRFFFFF